MAFRAPGLSRSLYCSMALLQCRYSNKNTPTNPNSQAAERLLSPPAKANVEQQRTRAIVESRAKQVTEEVVPMRDGQERTPLAHPPDHYFDTHQIVMKLQALGYSLEQSEILVSLMAESLHNSLKPMWATVITQKDMKLVEQQLMWDIKALQSDLELMKRGTLDKLRLETTALEKESQNLLKIFKEEARKLQSGIKVDLNSEKCRIKVESTVLQQRIKDTNSQLSSEIAKLKSQMAAQKFESFKYLAGGIISVITIVISVTVRLWRLIK